MVVLKRLLNARSPIFDVSEFIFIGPPLPWATTDAIRGGALFNDRGYLFVYFTRGGL